jgi:hypothetical protein
VSTPYSQVTSVSAGQNAPEQAPALLPVEDEAKLLAQQAKEAEGFQLAGEDGQPA